MSLGLARNLARFYQNRERRLVGRSSACLQDGGNRGISGRNKMLQAPSSVLSLLIGAGILILGNGLIGILLPIQLGAEHISPETTGLIMSAYYAGFMLGSMYGQVVIQRVGHIRAFAAFAALITVTVMLYALVFNPALWAVLRALMG